MASWASRASLVSLPFLWWGFEGQRHTLLHPMWVLGIHIRVLMLYSKHFTHRTVSPALDSRWWWRLHPIPPAWRWCHMVVLSSAPLQTHHHKGNISLKGNLWWFDRVAKSAYLSHMKAGKRLFVLLRYKYLQIPRVLENWSSTPCLLPSFFSLSSDVCNDRVCTLRLWIIVSTKRFLGSAAVARVPVCPVFPRTVCARYLLLGLQTRCSYSSTRKHRRAWHDWVSV